MIDWRRQHYRCDQCGRASNERHPSFDKNHFITSRFAEWVKTEAATKNFAQIAKQAGMNHALLRRLFHSFAGGPTPQVATLSKALGIARVRLAGRYRPLLADISERKVVNVFASDHGLESFLDEQARSPAGAKVSCIVRDIHFDLLGLLTSSKLHRLFPSLLQTVISSRSLAAEAVEMIVSSCDPLFKQCAAAEAKSPKSVRHLFCRRKRDLKTSAQWRVQRWEEKAPELLKIYNEKEQFLSSWIDRDGLSGWPRAVSNESSGLRFDDVADLLHAKRNEVEPCFNDVALVAYQSWLEDIRKYEIKGTHSFAAARHALLIKYGRISERADVNPN
ncbi:MAG: transposase [Xanthobacteraceae bacterium]|nr:transposase [Xanthobacteraceae bacterium]